MLTQGIEHDTFYATYVMDSSMAWIVRSGYTDANGKPVEIDYQACTTDTAGSEYDQRADESDVDFYVRQKAFLAQLDAEYRACVLAQGVEPLRNVVPLSRPGPAISVHGSCTRPDPFRPVPPAGALGSTTPQAVIQRATGATVSWLMFAPVIEQPLVG